MKFAAARAVADIFHKIQNVIKSQCLNEFGSPSFKRNSIQHSADPTQTRKKENRIYSSNFWYFLRCGVVMNRFQIFPCEY